MLKFCIHNEKKTKQFGYLDLSQNVIASSGNRTRAARVAGEHSTTEPTMLSYFCGQILDF